MLQSHRGSGTEAARPPEFVQGQAIAARRDGRRGGHRSPEVSASDGSRWSKRVRRIDGILRGPEGVL